MYAEGGNDLGLIVALPRQEWSDPKLCELAVATRLSLRNTAKVMGEAWDRWQRHNFNDVSDNAGRAAILAARYCANSAEASLLAEGLKCRPRIRWNGWLRDEWRHRKRAAAPSADVIIARCDYCTEGGSQSMVPST